MTPMHKNYKKRMMFGMPAAILAQLYVLAIFDEDKISSIPEGYIKVLNEISFSFVPVALIIGLLVIIMPMLKNNDDMKDLEAGSGLYIFTTFFITFFSGSYIGKFFEFKDALMILTILIIITLVARLILKAIDKLDELWRKICYESCCLGSYITIGFSVMYAIIAKYLIKLPSFQPEWCAYAIVFFSIVGFMFVRFKYTYEK